MAAVGLLAAGAMHEINNPISAIIGYAQLLLKSTLGERQRADVERIAAEALRASRIVHNLLAFARPIRLTKAPLDISGAVHSALEVCAPRLAGDGIAVRADLRTGLPSVAADAYQLEQVFINIIVNARDAMLGQAGERRLTISTAACDSRVRVVFDDSGPGIPEDCLHRIFDPFFTTKEQGQGTGLGLAICYGIVRDHGGSIAVDNLPQGGARFIVELPTAAQVTHDHHD
jgi:two-component system NtrC family sensor kinase